MAPMTDAELDARLAACTEPAPKAYREGGLTDADWAALDGRVFVLEPGVVFWKEVAHMTPTSVTRMITRLDALTEAWDGYVMVVDLSGARRPDAETREALEQVVRPQLRFAAMYTRANVLLRMAASYVVTARHPDFAHRIVGTREEALRLARAEAAARLSWLGEGP